MKPFKNILTYRLNRDIPLDVEEISKMLGECAFSPCGSQDMAKSGWCPVAPNTDSLFYQDGGLILLAEKRETKNIPGSVVSRHLAEKVDKLELEQARKLRKSERDSLRDEVLHTLIPRAFSNMAVTRLIIDTVNNRIYVDTASAKRAEDVLALLRKSLGSLPVVPLRLESPAELTMTDWLKSGEIPAGLALGEEVVLKAILEDGGVITGKKQDLISDEIAAHLEAGKLVTSLALDWQERATFRLGDDFAIKSVKVSDSLLEQNDDIDREDIAARFAADFLLMTTDMIALVSGMVEALGGEAKQ